MLIRLNGGGDGSRSTHVRMICARRKLKLTALSSWILSKVLAIIAMSMLIISTAESSWKVTISHHVTTG